MDTLIVQKLAITDYLVFTHMMQMHTKISDRRASTTGASDRASSSFVRPKSLHFVVVDVEASREEEVFSEAVRHVPDAQKRDMLW